MAAMFRSIRGTQESRSFVGFARRRLRHRLPSAQAAWRSWNQIANDWHLLPCAVTRISVLCRIGSDVNPETVVCIIEAMKVMNEIKAEVKGVLTQILVENAKPVEFGQPLFKIRPA